MIPTVSILFFLHKFKQFSPLPFLSLMLYWLIQLFILCTNLYIYIAHNNQNIITCDTVNLFLEYLIKLLFLFSICLVGCCTALQCCCLCLSWAKSSLHHYVVLYVLTYYLSHFFSIYCLPRQKTVSGAVSIINSIPPMCCPPAPPEKHNNPSLDRLFFPELTNLTSVKPKMLKRYLTISRVACLIFSAWKSFLTFQAPIF